MNDPLKLAEVLEKAIISMPRRFTKESDLQTVVAAMLEPFEGYVREKNLGRWGRIDFAIGRLGIECKVKGKWNEVSRQLYNYAHSEEFDCLILLTTRQFPDMQRGPSLITNRRGQKIDLIIAEVWK